MSQVAGHLERRRKVSPGQARLQQPLQHLRRPTHPTKTDGAAVIAAKEQEHQVMVSFIQVFFLSHRPKARFSQDNKGCESHGEGQCLSHASFVEYWSCVSTTLAAPRLKKRQTKAHNTHDNNSQVHQRRKMKDGSRRGLGVGRQTRMPEINGRNTNSRRQRPSNNKNETGKTGLHPEACRQVQGCVRRNRVILPADRKRCVFVNFLPKSCIFYHKQPHCTFSYTCTANQILPVATHPTSYPTSSTPSME